MKYIQYFFRRMTEASTYASIAAVVVSAASLVGPAKYAAIAAGVVGVFLPS